MAKNEIWTQDENGNAILISSVEVPDAPVEPNTTVSGDLTDPTFVNELMLKLQQLTGK